MEARLDDDARALYKRPKILLLDEATSHLDIATERALNATLARLRITRIVLAHRPETLASAQRVIDLAKLREPASPKLAGQQQSPCGPDARHNQGEVKCVS